MEKRTRSLIKNTTILSFGTLCTRGIMFVLTPLFTRWISTEDYGTFDLIVTYITLLLPVLTLSTGEAVFRFLLDKEEKEKNAVISTAIVINIFAVFISVLGVVIAIICFHASKSVAIPFIAYLTAELLYNLLMMILRGDKHLDTYTVANIIFVLALAAFVTCFVFVVKMGLPGLILGYACGYFLASIYMAIQSRLLKRFSFKYYNNSTLKEMLKYSAPLIPNAISWWIVNVSDRTIISFFIGLGPNAIYAISNKLPSLCSTFFNVFHLSWQQSATESMTDDDRDAYYNSVFNKMTVLIASICILVLGINYWFFKLLFTEEYYSGVYQAPILVIAIIFSMLAQFIGGIYIAQMNSKKNGFTTAIAAVVNILVNLLLIKFIGLFAASISTLCAYVTLFLIRYIDIRRDIRIAISNKSKLIIILAIIIAALSYWTEFYIQVFVSIVSIAVFIFYNKSYMKSIFGRVAKKS